MTRALAAHAATSLDDLADLALRHGTALGLDDDVALTAERDARYLVRLHRGRYRALWRTDPSTDAGKVAS